jgi:hypothetical protein
MVGMQDCSGCLVWRRVGGEWLRPAGRLTVIQRSADKTTTEVASKAGHDIAYLLLRQQKLDCAVGEGIDRIHCGIQPSALVNTSFVTE